MNKGQAMVHSKDYDWNSKGLCQRKYHRKFEGYMLSDIGSRSVPVSRQAGRLSDENVISYEFFTIL